MNCLQTDWNGRHYPVSFIDFPIVDVFVLSWRIHFNSILFQILLNPWFVLAPLLHSSANNQQSTRLVPYSTIRFRITSRVKVSALAITGITLTTPLRRLRTWRSSGRRLCPVGGMKYKQQWIRVSTMKRPRCALCSSLKYVSYWFSMYFNAGSQLFTIFNIHHSFDMKQSFPSIYQLVLSIWSPNPGVSVTLKSSLMPFSTITGTQKKICFNRLWATNEWDVPVRVVRMQVVLLIPAHLPESFSCGSAVVRNKVLISVDLPNPLLPNHHSIDYQRINSQSSIKSMNCMIRISFFFIL